MSISGSIWVFICIPGEAEDVSPELRKLLQSLNGEKVDSPLGERIHRAVRNALNIGIWRKEYMTLAMRDQMNVDKGKEIGIKLGKEEGLKLGIEQGKIDSIKNLMQNGHLNALQAMDMLGIPVDDRQKFLKNLG